MIGSLAGNIGVDTGIHAAAIPKAFEGSTGQLPAGSWIRLREMAPQGRDSTAEVAGLASGVKAGLNLAVLQRWPAESWDAGVRPEGAARLPVDLREAFERSRGLGLAYGVHVRAWEIDNEPDLGFVPESAESYTAFLKAMYLGLQRGFAEDQQRAASSEQRVDQATKLEPRPKTPRGALVIMGSLGLPPGPWLERFAANDGFAYTDGFNYHYYGYAEDFSGVYRQHEAALRELTSQVSGFGFQVSHTSVQKNLPVFLTEVGYGMLGKSVMNTKEGRLRQWRWFKSVGEQATNLKIEAPMAFVLQPYLEYDTLEFGLTQKPGAGSLEQRGQRTSATTFRAGGIVYTAEDFGAQSAEPWMEMIGQEIGGHEITPALAQWMGVRGAHRKAEGGKLKAEDTKSNSDFTTGSRSWSVSVSSPSPVVIDFINGEGLSFVKRYNGSFVVGRSPVTAEKAEEPKSQTPDAKPETPLPSLRKEELMIHVRTQNGNLYEVYPTRLASPDWQNYLEPHDNFTMSFYGRAEIPWRFKDNKPASLVVVMYPKSLPAVYEFRRPQLIKLGAGSLEQGVNFRYGRGTVVLYNFSDKEIAGKLMLPAGVERVAPNALSTSSASSPVKLMPMERREITVSIKVPWGKYERIEAPVTFLPDDSSIPLARFLTAFLPDIGGLNQTVVAALLPQPGSSGTSPMDGKVGRVAPNAPKNRELVSLRPRATEEAPMFGQGQFFAQEGAKVEATADGFTVTVTETPPDKEQRVEVEIPWPEGLVFSEDDFLSLDFRLRK